MGQGRKIQLPPGILLLGAGLGPVVFALKHRGEDGWWLGLLGLPLAAWGMGRLLRFLGRLQV